MRTLETKDWWLDVEVGWKPKQYDTRVDCVRCGGSGAIGGGFKDMDGRRDCPDCCGRGWNYTCIDREERPEQLPEGLVEHLRKAFEQYQLLGAASAPQPPAPPTNPQ
jgi:hypothetical protein